MDWTFIVKIVAPLILSIISLIAGIFSIFKGIHDAQLNRKFNEIQLHKLNEISDSAFKNFIADNKLAWTHCCGFSTLWLPDVININSENCQINNARQFWKEYYSHKDLVYRTKIVQVATTDQIHNETFAKNEEIIKKLFQKHNVEDVNLKKIFTPRNYSKFEIRFLLDKHLEESESAFLKILEKHSILELNKFFEMLNKCEATEWIKENTLIDENPNLRKTTTTNESELLDKLFLQISVNSQLFTKNQKHQN